MKDKLEIYLKSLEDHSLYAMIGLGVVLGGLICIYLSKFGHLPFGTQENFGQFGDYIGGTLNPLVGFLALLALWKTASVQTAMLKEQIEKEDKKDWANQRLDFLKEQNEIFKRDYESYLSIINTIVYIKKGEVISSGKAAFYMLLNRDHDFKELNFYLRKKSELTVSNYSVDGLEKIVSEDPVRNNAFMNPVFRTIYQVLKDQAHNRYRSPSNPQEYNSQTYENIRFFRAQLSGDELIFIALNILFTEAGKVGLSRYVKEFGLLKHLHIEQLKEYVEDMHGADCFGRGYASKKAAHQLQP